MAVSLQLILLLTVFGFSLLGKQQTSQALAFDNAAQRLHLDFEQIAGTLGNFYSELSGGNPSEPYIEALQESLEPQLMRLDLSIEQISSASSGGVAFLGNVDAESLDLFATIKPDLEAFMTRAHSFARSDHTTLRARFARPSIVDLAAARTGTVRRSLKQLAEDARVRQKRNINYLQTGIFSAVALLLLLLLGSLRWIIQPALAEQKKATLREIAFLNDLKCKNTELQQAESRSRLLYEEAMTGIRARTEFLAVVSHELRTPLNAVIGFSEIMKDELLGKHNTAAYREYATDIHKSGKHLLGIVEDILEFSRYESGQYALEETIHPVDQIFTDVHMLIGDHARRKNITVLFRDRSPENQVLRIDRRLFNQALVNLLDNAVKFSPEGSRIVVCCREDAGGGIAIDVSDTGIGLDPEIVPVLLRPFEQIEGAFSRNAGGLGLGLAIAHKIMMAHGGIIDVCSTLGEGSCFSLCLPAKRVVVSGTMPRTAVPDNSGKVA